MARTIQNVCFAAYPPDLLERMSERPDPPPPEVREDPGLQMKYLKTEEVVRKGLFYPSWLDELLPAFRAEVRPGLTFLDLGSGDGRVVFLAAVLGAQATGLEWDKEIHAVSLDALGRLAGTVPRDSVQLRRADFFKEDFSRYDRIFYFGRGSFAEGRLAAQIARELRPGALFLLAHGDADPPGLERVEEYGAVRVYRAVRR